MNNHNNPLFDENHEQLMVLTDLVTVLVSAKTTAGKYVLWEDIVPPLAGPPPHSHPDEEVFYVMAGSFEFLLTDLSKPIPATVGSVIHIPSHTLHTFKNIGNTAGKLLTFSIPGKLENYFRAVGRPVRSARDIPDMNEVPDFSALDVTDFLALAPQHNVTFYLSQLVD
jgi:quercetin dioxygenase-like cupin family protein